MVLVHFTQWSSKIYKKEFSCRALLRSENTLFFNIHFDFNKIETLIYSKTKYFIMVRNPFEYLRIIQVEETSSKEPYTIFAWALFHYTSWMTLFDFVFRQCLLCQPANEITSRPVDMTADEIETGKYILQLLVLEISNPLFFKTKNVTLKI